MNTFKRGYCIYNIIDERYSNIIISDNELIVPDSKFTIFNSLFNILSGSENNDIIHDLNDNYIIYEIEYIEDLRYEYTNSDLFISTIYSGKFKIVNTITYEEYVDYIQNNQDLVLEYVDYLMTENSNVAGLSPAQCTLYSALYKMGLFRELILDAAKSNNEQLLLKYIDLVDSIKKIRFKDNY